VTFTIEPGALQRALDDACARLTTERIASALWTRRLDIWTSDAAVQRAIANRLGWLDAVTTMAPHLARIHRCASSVAAGNDITDIVLLGMGGSSLAPEVLRAVVGVAPGYPRFTVLDSVDPDAVKAAMARPASSLFVIASKSGSTIEPNALAAEAFGRLRASGIAEPGSRAIAITDEGTVLHTRAVQERFRDVFINPSDIGGRFSALSFFGLVPAALMGIDIAALLASASAMADACRAEDAARNPGLALGAFMAAAARAGRDKLTLALPPALESFGLWVEQLVAESTGKNGTGVVPIAGETAWPSTRDRAFVAIELAGAGGAPDALAAARSGGAPIASVALENVLDIGGEFFRWEMATAAAGLLLGVNPFDEPNVQQAKTATSGLLATYVESRRLTRPEPGATVNGARLTATASARGQLAEVGPGGILRLVGEGDYFVLLAYLPPDPGMLAALEEFRMAAARARTCTTMFGYGPRYLHSTGQLHKGGPNTGVFVIVTAEPGEDVPIPGEAYSFGVLEQAQAIGDFNSLDKGGRRALMVHLPNRETATLRTVLQALL
jgi:glucose-6-phosphate isomerase/transaldolase/glucose-6-phosphate isomerase